MKLVGRQASHNNNGLIALLKQSVFNKVELKNVFKIVELISQSNGPSAFDFS